MPREPVGQNEHVADVTVRGRTHAVVRDLGRIDFDNLRREVQEVGASAIWWGALFGRAQGDVGRAKLNLDVVESTTAKQLRVEKGRVGEKITDKIIEEETGLHANVRAAREALIEAEEQANILRSVSWAIDQKQRTLAAMTGALAREIGGAPDDPLRAAQRGRMTDRRTAVR